MSERMEAMCNDCTQLNHCSQNPQKDCYISKLEHDNTELREDKARLMEAAKIGLEATRKRLAAQKQSLWNPSLYESLQNDVKVIQKAIDAARKGQRDE